MTLDVIKRDKNMIFMRLPRELWKSAGRCDCKSCNGSEGFWDTLAVCTKVPAGKDRERDYAYTVHMPRSK